MSHNLPVSCRDLTPFYVMEIMAAAEQAEQDGHTICHMEVGELDFVAPHQVVSAVVDAIGQGNNGYTHSLGTSKLREAICKTYSSEGVDVFRNQVLVSTGTSPILMIAVATLTQPGDEVILFDPGYPCYPNFAKMCGAIPRFVPLKPEDGFRPNIDQVRNAISDKTRAIVCCSPANPTGVTLSLDDLAQLADLGVWLVVDEIYRGIEYDTSSKSALSLRRDNVIVVDGFSKKFAMTGYRLGFGIFPDRLMPEVEAAHQSLMISANPFVQEAGLAALLNEDVAKQRAIWMDQLRARRDLLLSGMQKLGIAIPAIPAGAFYLLADFRWTGDPSLQVAQQLLDQAGIAATPGIDFGQHGEDFLRFSFAKSEETIREALKRLENWLSTHPRQELLNG